MKKKNIFFACAASLTMLSFSSCSDDINYGNPGDGEGRVFLRPQLNSDVKVESRAILTDDELADNAIIWISNAKGAVRKYTGVGNVPAGGISLVSDNYVAEVWAGDSVPASFDHRYFKGREPFAVQAGRTAEVTVECRIANSVVAVEYEPAVDDVLTDYTMTVGHKAGELTFNGREDEGRPGYFMMPSFDKNLTCTLTGKKTDGSDFTYTRVIEDAKPCTKYLVKVKHGGPVEDEIGGALISIEVDDTEIEVEDVVEIYSAPTVEGTNFDITKPVMGQEGQLTEKKVWIKSTKGFKDLVVSCPGFSTLLGISGDDFEVFGMADNVKQALEAKGFSYQYFTHDGSDFEEIKLVFDDAFMNLFPNGEHNVLFTVTDNNGKTGTGVMQIILSDAKMRTDAVVDADVWATKATLRGTVMKPELSGFAFNYRERGAQQWQTAAVDGTFGEGSAMSLELTGLSAGTTYEYQAVCDGFDTSDVLTFTTEAALQLPNAGMEDWDTSEKSYKIHAPGGELFWDSGNQGATTMPGAGSITTPASDVKHSGEYSARLESKFVGLGTIGKFAAGNMFVGQYLATDGTDGVLGWGRPFASRPKALKVWVKYTPQTVTDSKTDELKKGDMDLGIVYLALVTDHTDEAIDSKGKKYGQWPVVVKTKDDKNNKRSLFDKNAANVIAYGERVFTEATGDMIEVEIPLEYYKTDVKASNIIVTCSASKYGDYFTGGPSVMYVDDFELVY